MIKMIDYVIFEKKGECSDWDKTRAVTFCTSQNFTVLDVTEELDFIIVKTGDRHEDDQMRLFEVTPTVTFLIRDDPSLDEFLEVETVHNAVMKYDKTI